MTGRLRRPDLVLAAGFLVGHAIERLINPAAAGSPAANAAGAVLMSVPLLWVRSRPIVAVAGVAVGVVANELAGATPVEEMFASILTLVVIGYAITRHHEGVRERWAPLGAALGLVALAEGTLGEGAIGFVCLLVAAGALGGALVRNRVSLTRELADRTHELEALREAHERDAVLDERRRIARELHDVVAHTVSIMVVQAGGARRQLDRDPARAVAALDQVQETGEETLRELRRLFGLLHAEEGERGLDDVPSLVERAQTAGLPVALDVEGEPRPLDPVAGLAAYRLVQEALTNTLKHAGPGATARIEVRWSPGALELRVADTGWGADGPRGDGSRRGLVGMRERMAAFDGQVEAGPGPDGGFEVRASLPLAREEVQIA